MGVGRVEKRSQPGVEAPSHRCSQHTPDAGASLLLDLGGGEGVSLVDFAHEVFLSVKDPRSLFGGALWSWGARWCVETES